MNSKNLSITRLKNELKMLQKIGNQENFYALPDSNDWFKWHFVIHDLKDSPYEGGYYYGLIYLPETYPLSPPNILFKTPNGRFKQDQKICLSFTSYHTETWDSTWNIRTMILGVISIMNTDLPMLGGIQSSDDVKITLAKDSLNFNRKQKDFVKYFNDKFKDLNADGKNEVNFQLT